MNLRHADPRPHRRRRRARARPGLEARRRAGRERDLRRPRFRRDGRGTAGPGGARCRSSRCGARSSQAARSVAAELVVVGTRGTARRRCRRRAGRRRYRGLRADAGGGAPRVVQGLLPRGRGGGRACAWRAHDPSGRTRATRPRRSSASWRPAGAGAVLKADGLAAGKGVIVTESTEQALRARPVIPRRPTRRRAGPGDRGATRRPRGERHRDLRRQRRHRAAARPATTSGCATATSARTRAGWAPTRRCRTSTTPPSSGSSRRSTGRSSPRWPGAVPRSAASCTQA